MEKNIKKLKGFQKWFDGFVKRNYGKKCSEFTWNRRVCHVYFIEEDTKRVKVVYRDKKYKLILN